MSERRVGFRLWAEAEPERRAVVDAGGRTWTYGELQADVNRLTHGLRDVAGLRPGDTVACLMANGVSMLRLYLAAMQSGLYLVTINYHLTAAEVQYLLEDSGAKALVCSVRVADVAGTPRTPPRSRARRSSPTVPRPACGRCPTSPTVSPRRCPRTVPRAP